RQVGFALPLALTLGCLWERRWRPAPGELRILVLAWLLAGAALLLPSVLGMVPPTQANRLGQLAQLNLRYPVGAVLVLPGLAALVCLPYLAGLASAPATPAPVPRRVVALVALLAFQLVAIAAL